MRPIWSGYISFGLVNIPISLYSAERRFDLRFHMLDSRDQARIRYQRVNEETGAEVPWNKVVKAYEFTKDNYVVLKEEDLNQVSTTAKTVQIESFVAAEEIDFEYFEVPYYLVPSEAGRKSYVLLREALREEKKMGVARLVIHGREHLAVIAVLREALVLDLLRFKQELRSVQEFDFPKGGTREFGIHDKEMKMAKQLIVSMTEPWKPELYHDEYREALMAWIEKKIKGKKTKPAPAARGAPRRTQDLMSLMKKSLQAMHKGKKAKNEPHTLSSKKGL